MWAGAGPSRAYDPSGRVDEADGYGAASRRSLVMKVTGLCMTDEEQVEGSVAAVGDHDDRRWGQPASSWGSLTRPMGSFYGVCRS